MAKAEAQYVGKEDLVPAHWSDSKKSVTVDEYVNERQKQSHACGRRTGMEAAARKIMASATYYFAQGNDENAKLLRALALELQADAAKEYTPPE